MNFAKFLRAPFLKEHLWWLNLKYGKLNMWLCKKIFVKNFRNINRKTPVLEFLFKNVIKKGLGAFL